VSGRRVPSAARRGLVCPACGPVRARPGQPDTTRSNGGSARFRGVADRPVGAVRRPFDADRESGT